MTCKQWGVVVVPFPFSPHPGTKRRPALVLGGRTFNARGQTVLGMITTSGYHRWPGDVTLAEHKAAGLRTSCLVRLKLFTLDNRLILKQIGRLSASDRKQVTLQLRTHLP